MKLLQSSKSKKSSLLQTLRRPLLIGLVSGLAITSITSYAADFTRVEKELRIMSKIFEASMSDSKDRDNRNLFSRSFQSTEATYLANQGMVFSFRFGSNRFGNATDWQVFGEGVGHLVNNITREIGVALSDIEIDAPEAPIPDLRAPQAGNWGADWEESMEAYDSYREAMEDLRDQNRHHRDEVRDLQRSIREIEREARREEGNKGELEKTKRKLEKKMKELSKKMEVYEKSMEDYKKKQKEKYTISNKKRSDAIVNTLCDYGATLRSLKNKEHITLVFKDFENGKDQIHVFSYQDVKDCSSKDKLLKQATSYLI